MLSFFGEFSIFSPLMMYNPMFMVCLLLYFVGTFYYNIYVVVHTSTGNKYIGLIVHTLMSVSMIFTFNIVVLSTAL